MGTDISGFIECRPWPQYSVNRPIAWTNAIDLNLLYVDRDYDAFGCLFGAANFAGFEPVAAYRGLPGDVSPAARAAYESSSPVFGATWIGWTEVVAIDWDEPAARPDSRIHEYRRDGNGDLTYTGKASWSAKFAEAAGLDPGHANPGYDGHAWPEGSEWHTDEVTYRLERLHRRDAIGPGNRQIAPLPVPIG
jgi:hypothetical protein